MCIGSVGYTGAALVEDKDAGEGRDVLDEAGERGQVPHRIDVGEPLVHEHDVDRATTEDLVADVVVVDHGVAGVRPAGHRGIVRSPLNAERR